MTADTPAIEFRNVSLSFDGKRVLDDVSLVLPRGQMFLVTGASGSGMTLLLRMAIGLEQPDSGELFVEGHELDLLRESELLQLRSDIMGMVFQEQSLFTALSVFDNVAYRLDEHGWKEADIEKAVMETLRFVGLDRDRDKLPEELSIGMRRRLEVARAIAGWPPIMLFDEATAGLDPINARQMMDLVTRARDIHHISALYVTKEMHEIAYLINHTAVADAAGQVEMRVGRRADADRMKIIVMDAGRIAFFGTDREFATSQLAAVTQLIAPKATGPHAATRITDPRQPSRAAAPHALSPAAVPGKATDE
jgi:ABC-type transporter Mla maintaining outer membrane lipid asymmetry ATPase subunit MlaF